VWRCVVLIYDMKYKILLLLLSFFVVLGSCKKDKNEPKPDTSITVKAKLLGKWQLTKAVANGYDKAGKLVKTEEEKAETSQIFEFSASSAKSTSVNSEKVYEYNLTDANSKVYLNLVSSFTDTYELAIDNNTMTWAIEEDVNGNPDYTRVRLVYYFDRK
jgi:hypothetical protein